MMRAAILAFGLSLTLCMPASANPKEERGAPRTDHAERRADAAARDGTALAGSREGAAGAQPDLRRQGQARHRIDLLGLLTGGAFCRRASGAGTREGFVGIDDRWRGQTERAPEPVTRASR